MFGSQDMDVYDGNARLISGTLVSLCWGKKRGRKKEEQSMFAINMKQLGKQMEFLGALFTRAKKCLTCQTWKQRDTDTADMESICPFLSVWTCKEF